MFGQWRPTPAMEATTARYRACAGRHVPGEEVTEPRPPLAALASRAGGAYVQMPICRRCGVPIVKGAVPILLDADQEVDAAG
jgi:hypothetical protein